MQVGKNLAPNYSANEIRSTPIYVDGRVHVPAMAHSFEDGQANSAAAYAINIIASPTANVIVCCRQNGKLEQALSVL